ncbi:MAG: hypothetical protein LC658_11600, partial [Bacteroidales bacterium]|nr:hypothetical protein [Bacteroidales bacterium]
MVFMLAQQKTAAEAAQTTLKELNLTVLETKRETVNGLPAVAAISQQVSQNQQTGQQQAINVMSYFIEYGGQVYVFHGVSSDIDFNSFASLFESTMKSFNRLTDASKLNIKPKRVRIKKVQQNGTLADAFRYFGVPQSQMNELALLNNLELSDNVKSGKLIKIIGN